MSNLQKNQAISKAAYTKPTLIEYGSLAERTKMFGLLNPEESNPDALTPSITSLTF
jgi:hypothetical protein